MGAAALAVVRCPAALTLTSIRPNEHREREPASAITELIKLALLRNIALAVVMNSGFATPEMTLCQIRPASLALALLPVD
jgi:hypothetical protein